MSVLLLILKIIGWILLVILALLLIILLVPIRYSGDLSYLEKDLNGHVVVSWLLHAAEFRLKFENSRMSHEIVLFGFLKPFGKAEKGPEESDKTADNQDAGTESAPGDAAPDSVPESTDGAKAGTDGAVESTPQDPVQAGGDPVPEEKADSPGFTLYEDRSEKHADEADFSEEIPEEPEKAGEAEQAGEAEEADGEKTGLFDKLLRKIEELREKYRDIADKAAFVLDERTRTAVSYVLLQVGKILKHILPKRIEGWVAFGLDSPADTGALYGFLTGLYPLSQDRFYAEPVFTETCLEGSVKIRGRIVLGYFIVVAVRLILKKEIRWVLKNFKKHFGKKS